jgi:hypothetical protein
MPNSAVALGEQAALFCASTMNAKTPLAVLASTTHHGSHLLQIALLGGPQPAKAPKLMKKACLYKWMKDVGAGNNHRMTLPPERLTPATAAVAAADPGFGSTAT